ncbi:hypothetical protein [Thalassolituus sp.]|uniref:hypothetical protein n=1 Tax=Thalassolituus sp. TaxID=2030822 RepID=UPI00260C8738|nr:hypothetical protein [uncultured Thalassolituus sp.]TNC92750.1 MAG: hypothetical protein CSH36_02900 [Thalassolituus sp.]
MKEWILPVTLLFSVNCLANDGKAATGSELQKRNDNYYSEDLDAAVEEARARTHHYDYSNSLRYERTTSQSIQFPRLQNDELESTAIETLSLGATAAGKPEELQPDNESGEELPKENDFGLILNDRLRGNSFTPIESAPREEVTYNGVNITIQSR